MESISIGWQTVLAVLAILGGIGLALLLEKLFPTTKTKSVLGEGVILCVGLVAGFGGAAGIFYFFKISMFLTILMTLLEVCGVSLLSGFFFRPRES